MFKIKLFIVLAFLTLFLLISVSATCSMCGVQVSDAEVQGQSEQNDEDNNTDQSGPSSNDQNSQSPSQSSDSQKKDDKDTKDGKSASDDKDSSQQGDSDGQQNTNTEITDIIVGDVVDEHVEPADFFFTDSTYTCYPVLTIPPDGTEIYNWGVSGGSCDNGAFYMQWTTPLDEGWYTVTLNLHKGDNWGFFNKDFYIEPKTDMGPPLEGPQITDLIVSGAQGSNGIMDINTQYDLIAVYTDPNNLVKFIDFDVDIGTKVNIFNDELRYNSPDFETDVNITVYAKDSKYNVIVQETFTLMVRDIDVQ